MRNNAFKGEKNGKFNCEITRIKAKKRESQSEITRIKAKKRESQMRNNAKVKGEITLLKAKKRESQMRNNANKGEKTRKSNAKLDGIYPKTGNT